MLWIMYFFNFLDRNALVNAKLNSLEKDLGLKGTQYNTLISILFVGYIAGQIPSNMILNRVRPSWYLGGFCMAWSIVCLLTFKANDFGGMLACRFLLGVTEAPVRISGHCYNKAATDKIDSSILVHFSCFRCSTLRRKSPPAWLSSTPAT